MNLSRFYKVPKIHPSEWEIRFFENENGRGVVWPNKPRWLRFLFTVVMIFPIAFFAYIGWPRRDFIGQYGPPLIAPLVISGALALLYLWLVLKIRKYDPGALFIDRQGIVHTPYGVWGERNLRRTRFHIDDVTSVEYGAWSEWNNDKREGFQVFIMMNDGYRLPLSWNYNRDGASQIAAAVRKLVG